MRKKIILAALGLVCLLATTANAAERTAVAGKFEQKVVKKYPLGNKGVDYVNSLAACGESIFAGTKDGVLEYTGDGWQEFAPARGIKVAQISACLDQGLLVGSQSGKGMLIPLVPGEKIIDLKRMPMVDPIHDCYGVVSTFSLLDNNKMVIDCLPSRVTAVGYSQDEQEWLGLAGGGLARIWKERAIYRDDNSFYGPAHSSVRDVAIDGSGNVYVATGRGVARFDGKSEWKYFTAKEGLPYEDDLSIFARDGIFWVGTEMGAARWDGQEWQYLEGAEYLLNDRVIDVAITPDQTAWLATPNGVSRIEYRLMTLGEKAAHYEKITRERHLRYGLVSDSRLGKPGDLSTNQPFPSDNDGLWTAMYIAAECYRYAATKDPEARKFAQESLKAMMFLETVTEIPGLMARSFVKPGEPVDTFRGDHPLQWDNYAKDGKWQWKSDTSSDEVVGHYYAYTIYYDLCADEAEKAAIQEKVRRISDYIIKNNYYLLDTDGKPTTYGYWNFFSPAWRRLIPARGLNSLEILSHLKVAYHITGDEKYQKAYLDLALKKDYAAFTVNQKINIPGFINHSDDELAFLSYYPLLKYEKDPRLLAYYRRSLDRSWKIERPEKNPLFNFIYGAVSPEGTDFDLEGALFTLKRISLDLVRWDHHNSQRADFETRVMPGRFKEKQSKVPLPPDERTVMKWNGNPYELDTGTGWQPTEARNREGKIGGGLNEEAGTFWLLPYWMGRSYGFIREE